MRHVAAEENRGGHQSPKRHVGILLVPGQRARLRQAPAPGIADPPDLDVIRVVPGTGPGPGPVLRVLQCHIENPVQLKSQVPRCAPRLSAHCRTPLPDIPHAILAMVEQYVPGLLPEQAAHQPVGVLIPLKCRCPLAPRGNIRRLRISTLGNVPVGAPVILQKVKAPLCKSSRIDGLMLVCPAESTAGQRPRGCVKPRLQSLPMDVIGEALHVGKILVGHDPALVIPQRPNPLLIPVLGGVHPAVINVHVAVAHIRHPARNHQIRRLPHHLVRHPVVMCIPMIPAHRRRQRKGFPGDDPQGSRVRAVCVLRPDRHCVGSSRGVLPGNDPCRLIHLQPGRKPGEGEFHRAHPLRRNAVEERIAGTAAVNRRPVKTGLRPGFRREDHFFLHRNSDSHRCAATGHDPRLGPVRMVKSHPVPPVQHLEQQGLRTLQIHIDTFGRGARFHHPRVELLMPIHRYAKHHCGRAIRCLVHPRRGEKLLGTAGEINPERAGGMGPHPPLIFLTRELQGPAPHGPVRLCRTPPLAHQ